MADTIGVRTKRRKRRGAMVSHSKLDGQRIHKVYNMVKRTWLTVRIGTDPNRCWQLYNQGEPAACGLPLVWV